MLDVAQILPGVRQLNAWRVTYRSAELIPPQLFSFRAKGGNFCRGTHYRSRGGTACQVAASLGGALSARATHV